MPASAQASAAELLQGYPLPFATLPPPSKDEAMRFSVEAVYLGNFTPFGVHAREADPRGCPATLSPCYPATMTPEAALSPYYPASLLP